jgi:hypothetical protein
VTDDLPKKRERVSYPGLPLAVYRELAAHLRQVEETQVEPIAQDSQQFDYNQSQISGLQLEYPTQMSDRVEAILSYYADRYGSFER